MHHEDFLPTQSLRPFIKGYKIIESRNEIVNRILPGTSLALAFRFKGQTNYVRDNGKDGLPAITFSGLRKSVRLINYLNDSATLIVMFKEGGAAAFFRQPLYELFEESVSLDHFASRDEMARVEDHLAEALTHHQRIIAVENFLLNRLTPREDKLISFALQKISDAKGNIRMKELMHSLPLSTDAFEKRFRKLVGTSAKQHASIVRLQSIIRQGPNDQTLAQLALEAGYFDQPHFNKDFKLFTGQSPKDFFKSRVFW